jgi:hypothetical protein
MIKWSIKIRSLDFLVLFYQEKSTKENIKSAGSDFNAIQLIKMIEKQIIKIISHELHEFARKKSFFHISLG